jgi:hypothetical protein
MPVPSINRPSSAHNALDFTRLKVGFPPMEAPHTGQKLAAHCMWTAVPHRGHSILCVMTFREHTEQITLSCFGSFLGTVVRFKETSFKFKISMDDTPNTKMKITKTIISL